MKRFVLFAVTVLMTHVTVAAEPPTAGPDSPKAEPTKAAYAIMGLHCPPCTRTVESSLKKVKGVKAAKVDWDTKTAKIEFDESVLPAQKLAQAIAATPHMMGGGMHYGSWLTLKVPDLKDDATAKQIKTALEKQKGVKRVVTYPAQHAVNVEFNADGAATTRELIDAVAAAGLSATTN